MILTPSIKFISHNFGFKEYNYYEIIKCCKKENLSIMDAFFSFFVKEEEVYMKINLKNIAKVIDADISMDAISIIAGNNNAGKSTILKSIYVVVNLFRNINEKIEIERSRSLYSIIKHSEDYFDTKGYDYLPKDILEDFYNRIKSNISFLSEKDERFLKIKQCFHQSLDDYEVFINIAQKDELYSDDFLRPLYEQIEEIFKQSKEALLKYIGDMYIKGTFNSQINFALDISAASIRLHQSNGDNAIEIKDNKIENLYFNSISEADAIYIPAFNMLDIINSNRLWGWGAYSPEGDIRKYLSNRLNQDGTFEEYSETEHNISIIKEIIDEVVNGDLKVSNSGIITYNDNDLGISVAMGNVASGIKNFLLIKKLVENGALKKNGVLLIDEPETNLHPEWHLKFAELLVLMHIHMGVVTVVNSHSPYFIRALEVKMADYGIKNKGHFYLMKEEQKNRYVAEDVSENTEQIYQTLYKPLEYL